MPEYPLPVLHERVPDDPFCREAGAPPKEPFEAAGFEVKDIAWANRGVRRSRLPMPFPDYENERLQEFRKRYDFLSFMEEGKTEFDRILRLRNWVSRQWTHGMPVKSTDDPFVILDLAARGGIFYCSMFARVFQSCLVATGRPSRHVGNVSNYTPEEGSLTHGVTDVFVQDLGKWVMLDANYDFHFEKDGVPLSPWELGEEGYLNNGRGVVPVGGPERKPLPVGWKNTVGGKHETWRALWNHHRWNTDPFTRHGSWFGTWSSQLTVVLVGKRHEGVTCYRGKAPGSEIDKAYFDGRMHFTKRETDVYPDVGTAHLELSKGESPGTVRVAAGTYTPNFDTLRIQVNDSPWRSAPLEFDWYPKEEANVLRVRTRDKFGNLGRESSVRVTLKKKNEGK